MTEGPAPHAPPATPLSPSDAELLQVAYAFEQATFWAKRAPELSPASDREHAGPQG